MDRQADIDVVEEKRKIDKRLIERYRQIKKKRKSDKARAQGEVAKQIIDGLIDR